MTLHIKQKNKDVSLEMCIELLKSEYPILCVCKSEKGTLYLCDCLDASTSSREWVITETDKSVLEKLINGEVSVQQAFSFCDTVYHIWTENGVSKEKSLQPSEMPTTFFPKEKLYLTKTTKMKKWLSSIGD